MVVDVEREDAPNEAKRNSSSYNYHVFPKCPMLPTARCPVCLSSDMVKPSGRLTGDMYVHFQMIINRWVETLSTCRCLVRLQ